MLNARYLDRHLNYIFFKAATISGLARSSVCSCGTRQIAEIQMSRQLYLGFRKTDLLLSGTEF